jgi:hypothetical protein
VTSFGADNLRVKTYENCRVAILHPDQLPDVVLAADAHIGCSNQRRGGSASVRESRTCVAKIPGQQRPGEHGAVPALGNTAFSHREFLSQALKFR